MCRQLLAAAAIAVRFSSFTNARACAPRQPGGRVRPGGAAMSTASIIANYIEHNRCLGKRFATEETILTGFGRSVGDVLLRDIRHAMISQLLDRSGTNEATVRKKHRVLAGFFRFAVTRRRLTASPMPRFEWKRGAASYTPYIYSEAELKRLLAAVPAATGSRSDIDVDTLRTLLLLLYGAGLRRGEARRLRGSKTSMFRNR
jgi:integrase/recombinase XerD